MATVDTSILKLEDCHQADTLTQLLSLLFEPTPELQSLLVPSVLLRLTARQTPPRSYEELIDICQQVAEGWTWEQKAGFIAGHPMIGEVKTVGLSGKEQGTETRPIVLARLAHLNQIYSRVYPGLRYITFVNGRPRAAIVTELEKHLNLHPSPDPLPDDYMALEPLLDSEAVREQIAEPDGERWKTECTRDLGDVWKIGKARLKALGLESQ